MADIAVVDKAGVPPIAALEAAQRIVALVQVAQSLGQAIQAQMMEAAWVIRQSYPEQDGFCEFIGLHTGLCARQVWEMSEAWDVARQNRQLRELSVSAPVDAMRFIGQIVEAGVAGDDGVDDAEVTRLLAMRPRARTKAIRALIDKAGQASLLPEEAAVGDGGVVAMARSPVVKARELHARLVEVNKALAGIAADIVDCALTDEMAQKMLAVSDYADGHLETINARLMGTEDR